MNRPPQAQYYGDYMFRSGCADHKDGKLNFPPDYINHNDFTNVSFASVQCSNSIIISRWSLKGFKEDSKYHYVIRILFD